ncbi:hypothetical protein BGX23_010614 [Mortierella sp. AD031]|nr:hypothetical protein BGX23_010614 [Mortierella sp. AD031]
MVIKRSDSAYRPSQEVPETPLTPRTPRSPHLHRSKLTSPSARSRRGGLKREFPEDEDMDLDVAEMPSRRVVAPNSNPTPSELLSMDLTTLALHNRNNGRSTSNTRSALVTPSPSARFEDDATVERFNLTLPFDRIAAPNFGSSSSSSSSPSPFNNNYNHHNTGSLESVHRYPTRTATSQQDQSSPFTTPVKASSSSRSPFLRDGAPTPTAPSSAVSSSSIFASRSALQSPPRSSPRQFMNDEDNNLFLTQSPRAIRTPRKPMSQLDNNNMHTRSPAERSASTISASAASASSSSADYSASTSTPAALGAASYIQPVPTPAALMTPGASQLDFNDDDMTDTESVMSSQGDQEKENVTPKMSDDPSNPFYVSSESKRTMRYTKTDGSTTPTGCTTAPGTIRRSRRLALGSISPWRWNSFDEYGNLVYVTGLAGGLKGKGAEWTEGRQSKCSAAGESSLASSSGLGSASGLGAGTGAGSSSTSKPSMIGPPLNGKGSGSSSKQLPDNHPNAPDSGDRKGMPSKNAMKLAESMIQPQSVAFNRRAQQVAGRIYYWKNGTYQLVSESDKQQWPGEWKFEIYQDPESPGAPTALEETDLMAAASTNSSSAATTTPYLGKGKLTDRQLSGPYSKRMRVSGGAETVQQAVVGTSPHTLESELTSAGASLDTPSQELAPPASPTSAVNTSGSNSPQSSKLMGSRTGTPSKKARLQDRYDFRERRMLNEPLTPRSRRCGA